LEKGNVQDAVPFVNRSRQRAGLPALLISMSGSAFREELEKEKRREFFVEHGMRFFDLKRWGKLGGLITVKPSWKGYHSNWPIPQKELLINPNLNPQNNGY